MLWHIVIMDVSGLDEAARSGLETEIIRLRDIEDIRWFELRQDVERPGTTAFITVFDDRAALGRYRIHPVHLSVAQVIRETHAVVQRLDMDDLPLPS